MADEKQDQDVTEETPKDEKAPETEPAKPDEETTDKPDEDTASDDEGVVARGKYNRMETKYKQEIADLRAKVEEASKTQEGRDALQKQIEELQTALEDEKVEASLKLASCVNTKAARALLGDYNGDIEALKTACPYLFKTDKIIAGSGGQPAGSASKVDAKEAERRKILGLNAKE